MTQSPRSAEPFEVLRSLQLETPAILIDVRSRSEFGRGHADGAVSLPLGEITRDRLAGTPPGDRPVFVICETGVRARHAAAKLAAIGLGGAIVVAGGTKAWRSQGLPMARGPALWSIERQLQAVVGIALVALLSKSMLLHPAFYATAAILAGGMLWRGQRTRARLRAWLARMPWNRRPASRATASLFR